MKRRIIGSITLIFMGLSLIISGAALADPPAPPKTETKQIKDKDGNIIETGTVVFTDEDGDGKYDKTAYERKDPDGKLVWKITEKDENNDGKAETSTLEEFKDPTKTSPSTKATHTRGANDTGWRKMEEEKDPDQDGKPNEVNTCESKDGNGKFETITKKIDKSGNGVFEREEKLLAPIGGDTYDTKLTRTYKDPADGTEDSDIQPEDIKDKKIKIHNGSQYPPKMLTAPGGIPTLDKRAAGPASGDTMVSTVYSSVMINGILLDNIGSINDPLEDPAILAQFITPEFLYDGSGFLKNQGACPLILFDGDEILLKGVIPYLEYFIFPSTSQHLHPAAEIAFTGEFDLSSLRLAGVSSNSPFYDAALNGPQSTFILGLNDLFDPASQDYLAGNKLIFRFDAYYDLSGPNGNFDIEASSIGLAKLEAHIVPEPCALVLLIIGMLGICGWCKLNKFHKY